MSHKIHLRLKAGKSTEGDVTATIQDQTYDYLKVTIVPEIKVSAYLDQDWPQVETYYKELEVADGPTFKVIELTAGSKTRKVVLPGAMKSGEQLILRVQKIESKAAESTDSI